MVATSHLSKTISSETIQRFYQNVPSLMQTQRQWVVWKYQIVNGKEKKPPFNPRNGRAALPNDPATWGTLEQALARYSSGDYDGIGYVCHGDIVGGDLDHCWNPQTGAIVPWAQEIIDWIKPHAYIEQSPSDGIRFFMLADLPFDGSKKADIELYQNLHYLTFTGQHLEGTPIDLPSGPQVQSTLDTIVQAHFPEGDVNTGGGDATISNEPRPISRLSRSDAEVLEKMYRSKNGHLIHRLMTGNHQGQDQSRADLALCAHLAYWTNGDASQMDRLFRQSGLYRDKWDERHSSDGLTYGEMTVQKALHTSRDYSQPKPRRQERSIPHIPVVPQVTIEEHLENLATVGQEIQEQIRAHIESHDESALTEQVPPGVGKSRHAAAIGARTTQPMQGQYNVAWIAQRKNMIASVEDLRTYRHIQPCTKENCSDHAVHNTLGAKGYNTWSVHSKHEHGLCDYAKQFREKGSAVYQLPHVKSSYPAQHEAIVIDELDPSTWLLEREVTIEKLHTALSWFTTESTEDRFLRAFQGLITDAAQAKTPIDGKAVFDALEQASHGHLTNWLGELAHYAHNPRPFIDLDLENPEEEDRVQNLTPVILPYLLIALLQELVKWQKGQEWNSLIRVGPATHGGAYALYITEPLQITPDEEGHIPPVTLLDATADEEIHSRILGTKLKIHRVEVDPAPGTRHIAIRSGKRYGKTSLTTERKDGSPNKDLERTIKECRYMLQKLDPTGEQIRAESVGLISFMGCVNAIGESLGIPEQRRGHYWGIRGSNHLEDCSLLLLVGTPTLRPDELLRQARALYRDDPDPITETDSEEYNQTKQHTDPRLQHYAEYMTNSELTQAAHRNRPVRHANRTVVSFCLGEIDFLPATETITELPNLTIEGQDRYEVRRENEQERLEQAYATLTQDGKQPTQAELARVARVRKTTAAEWMREHHPPTVFTQSESSHDAIEHITSSNPGTSESENAPPDEGPPPGVEEGVKVMTPMGRGTVSGVYYVSRLGRVRISVILDLWQPDGTKWHAFDGPQVMPVRRDAS